MPSTDMSLENPLGSVELVWEIKRILQILAYILYSASFVGSH